MRSGIYSKLIRMISAELRFFVHDYKSHPPIREAVLCRWSDCEPKQSPGSLSTRSEIVSAHWNSRVAPTLCRRYSRLRLRSVSRAKQRLGQASRPQADLSGN